MNNILKDCFVAYIDILGVKNLVNNLEQNKKLLNDIINTIKINTKITEANKKETSKDGKLELRGFYFSDSFAFIMEKEPKNLPYLFLVIRYLQDRFWESKLCFRGAITIGKMYFPKIEENVLIGQGIAEAYKLESEIAIYPRIVVSDNLIKYIKNEKINAYPFSKDVIIELEELIKKDNDGVYFLDLLNKNILRKKGEKIEKKEELFSITWHYNMEDSYSDILQKVKNIVKKNLNCKKTTEKIKQKYEWLNSYIEETNEKSRITEKIP